MCERTHERVIVRIPVPGTLADNLCFCHTCSEKKMTLDASKNARHAECFGGYEQATGHGASARIGVNLLSGQHVTGHRVSLHQSGLDVVGQSCLRLSLPLSLSLPPSLPLSHSCFILFPSFPFSYAFLYFILSCFRSFVLSFLRSFVASFLRSFVLSFFRSFFFSPSLSLSLSLYLARCLSLPLSISASLS